MADLAVFMCDRINVFFYKKMYDCFAGPKKVVVVMR